MENIPYDNSKLKKPTYRNTGLGMQFCIFRIGKKYKDLGSIKGFERHMERVQDTSNADKTIKNEIIIGNENIYDNVMKYIEGCRVRKDTVYARELLLTASPQFFRGLMQKDLDTWIELQMKFLAENFGKNCVYATLHKDESTYHIHALIVPKFYNERTNSYTLSNRQYFNGVAKLREWQDNYSTAIQSTFKSLNRGIKYSKAKHVQIRQFYTMINEPINEKDIQQLSAKVKDSELLEVKLRAIQKTLETYKNIYKKTDLEKTELIKNNKELSSNISHIKAQSEFYKEALELLSEQYKLPQNAIKEVLKSIEKDLGREI